MLDGHACLLKEMEKKAIEVIWLHPKLQHAISLDEPRMFDDCFLRMSM
jgi:hypothetical protein